jgi:hypothetical protein
VFTPPHPVERASSLSSIPANTASPGTDRLVDLLRSDLADESDCWIYTAELIFHYMSVACQPFLSNQDLAATFQIEIPREAVSHPFLLRFILAFSAFHMAYLHPDKHTHYVLLANGHQNHGLGGLREALGQPVTSINCHALYASSMFLALNKFAAFSSCDDGHTHDCGVSPIHRLINIFHLMHGMSAIVSSSQDDIQAGPLARMFAAARQVLDLDGTLLSLAERVSALQLSLNPEDEPDDNIRSVLVSAVEALGQCIADARLKSGESSFAEARALFGWPRVVPALFLKLGRSGHPIALAIFAYYSCLLHFLRSTFWFFEGWAPALIECIMSKLKGSSWQEMVEWPASVVAGTQVP